MRNFATTGIILKKRRLGENDSRITLYSPLLGKISATARGTRRITSRFAGHLEPLNICELNLYSGAGGYTITQCRSTETFKQIRGDLDKTLIAAVACEIFEKTAYSPEQGTELFELFKSAMNNFNKSRKPALALESFKIKLMRITGILPDVKNTALHAEDVKIPPGIKKLINYICLCDFDAIEKISLSKSEEKSLKKTLSLFLQRYLDCPIASEKVVSLLSPL